MNFRIYAYNNIGPVYIETVYEEQYVEVIVNKLNRDVYNSVLIIKHNDELNMDEVYFAGSLEKREKMRRR